MNRTWVIELRPSPTAEVVETCCPPAMTAAATAVLGAGPVAWAAQVSRSAEQMIRALAPEFDDASGRDMIRRPTEACTLALLEMLDADARPDTIQVPPLVVAGVRDLVHRGFPLELLGRTIWTWHVHIHQELLAFLERRSGPELGAAEVRRVTELSFAFTDALSTRLVADFVVEREAWLDSVPALRRQTVDDIVAGRRPSARSPQQVLGLDLGRHLVAAVLWTHTGRFDTAGPDTARPGDPVRVARALAIASGAASSLVVPATETVTWLWMAFPGASPWRLITTLREGISAPIGIGVALGPVREGIDGFRQSHLAALRIVRIGTALATPDGPWLFDHAELDLLALLTDEPEHAAWFVRDQLGPLAAADPRTARLRETLRLYLRFGRSRSAAAEALHVVPNTVAYRVRQAEELLGGGIPSDPLRLRVALEVHDLVRLTSR